MLLAFLNCDEHIYANYLYNFNSDLKMTSERWKRRGLLSLLFIIKSISKKFLINIFINIFTYQQKGLKSP